MNWPGNHSLFINYLHIGLMHEKMKQMFLEKESSTVGSLLLSNIEFLTKVVKKIKIALCYPPSIFFLNY